MSSKLARAITRLPRGHYVRIDSNDPDGTLYLSLWEQVMPQPRHIIGTSYQSSTPWAKQFAQLLEQWMEEEEKHGKD